MDFARSVNSSQVIFICWIKLSKLNGLLFSEGKKSKLNLINSLQIFSRLFPPPSLWPCPLLKKHWGKFYKTIEVFSVWLMIFYIFMKKWHLVMQKAIVVKTGMIFCYTSFVMLPFQTSVIARSPYFMSTT